LVEPIAISAVKNILSERKKNGQRPIPPFAKVVAKTIAAVGAKSVLEVCSAVFN
jgi:hypothetical protein